jgi:hypothetical protein
MKNYVASTATILHIILLGEVQYGMVESQRPYF